MYTYNITQWLAFFIIYCFLGWVWESAYVSVRKRKWVNRGFMHGPLLPIYGSGAVIVLLAALPVRKSVIAVYFAGMIAATLLEYVTGAVMEALFKVRYWDYSNQRFNLNGHICLTSSLGWGLFSVAMVYWLHKPFERVVLAIPEAVLSPIVHVIMMLAAADFALSFKAAIELRDVLIKLEQVKEEIRLHQKRIEVYEAFLAEEAKQKLQKHEEEFDRVKKELAFVREELEKLKTDRVRRWENVKSDQLRLLRAHPSAISKKYKSAFEEVKNRLDLKNRIENKLERLDLKGKFDQSDDE